MHLLLACRGPGFHKHPRGGGAVRPRSRPTACPCARARVRDADCPLCYGFQTWSAGGIISRIRSYPFRKPGHKKVLTCPLFVSQPRGSAVLHAPVPPCCPRVCCPLPAARPAVGSPPSTHGAFRVGPGHCVPECPSGLFRRWELILRLESPFRVSHESPSAWAAVSSR